MLVEQSESGIRLFPGALLVSVIIRVPSSYMPRFFLPRGHGLHPLSSRSEDANAMFIYRFLQGVSLHPSNHRKNREDALSTYIEASRQIVLVLLGGCHSHPPPEIVVIHWHDNDTMNAPSEAPNVWQEQCSCTSLRLPTSATKSKYATHLYLVHHYISYKCILSAYTKHTITQIRNHTNVYSNKYTMHVTQIQAKCSIKSNGPID